MRPGRLCIEIMCRHNTIRLSFGEYSKYFFHIVDAERTEVLYDNGIVIEIGFDDQLSRGMWIEEVEQFGFVDLEQFEMDFIFLKMAAITHQRFVEFLE